MDPEAQVVVYLIALIAFAVGAAVSLMPPTRWTEGHFYISAGLFLTTLVFFWNAVEAV
jgi:hypothetical protein